MTLLNKVWVCVAIARDKQNKTKYSEGKQYHINQIARYSSLCFNIIHINWFHRYSFVFHYSNPDDYSSITNEGTEHKEDTSNHPEGNSCDIVSIFGSAGDNIVECVDKDEDCGDELLVYPATFTESSWV